jgi:hypothetical protein
MILLPNSTKMTEHFSLRLLETGIVTWPLPDCPEAERLLFERQPLTDGAVLRQVFRRSRVAVVGLSGGGSQVVDHLAALGVGEIIGIDNQTTDETNTFATPNLGWLHALFKVKKTTAARSRTWAINRHVKFTPVNGRVPEPTTLEALKRADLIVGCVNNLHARADLNEIAWRYCIPYVDIGLVLTTDERALTEPKPLNAISGNVFTAIPGGPCLWCTGFLTREKLDRETGGLGRPYLKGEHGRNVYVTTFNGALAAEGATEVVRLLVGLRRDSELKRFYDGFSGTLVECAVMKSESCEMCDLLAAGDPVWSAIRLSHNCRKTQRRVR